jgi:hypothetical protein
VAVSDTFELAIEMDGGVVWIAIFVFVGGFGLALFEGVVKVRLGEGLEGEQGKGEGGGGWVEATVVWVSGFFLSPSEALEEKCGGEEQEKGQEGPVNDGVDVHGRPLVADGSQAWTGAPNMAAAMFLIAGSGLRGRRTLEEGGPNVVVRCNNVVLTWLIKDRPIDQLEEEEDGDEEEEGGAVMIGCVGKQKNQ